MTSKELAEQIVHAPEKKILGSKKQTSEALKIITLLSKFYLIFLHIFKDYHKDC